MTRLLKLSRQPLTRSCVNVVSDFTDFTAWMPPRSAIVQRLWTASKQGRHAVPTRRSHRALHRRRRPSLPADDRIRPASRVTDRLHRRRRRPRRGKRHSRRPSLGLRSRQSQPSCRHLHHRRWRCQTGHSARMRRLHIIHITARSTRRP